MYGPPSDCKGKAKSGSTAAQMYSAFVWKVESPGHDELRCVLFLINGTVMEDHFREQVATRGWELFVRLSYPVQTFAGELDAGGGESSLGGYASGTAR